MKAKVVKTVNRLLRLSIMLITVYFLYRQVFQKTGIDQWLSMLEPLMGQGRSRSLFLMVLMLLPLNILLEAVKWQWLMAPLERVSLSNALAAVMAGIAFSLFLPNRVGDYAGRIFVLRKANPIEAVMLTIMGSFAQLLVIGLAGSVALLVLVPQLKILDFISDKMVFLTLLTLLFLLNVLAFLLFFNMRLVNVLFSGAKGWMIKLQDLLRVYQLLSKSDLLVVLSISAIRYVVFSGQFYLLILALGLMLPYFTGLKLISLIYLAITLIPTIAISELGIRGSVAVAMFAAYYNDQHPEAGMVVLAASSLLWLINLAFPALIGVLAINKMRFIPTDD